MGIFDRFRRQVKLSSPKQAEPNWENCLHNIAALITHENRAVLKETTRLTADPNTYFAAHTEAYSERFIDSPEDLDTVQWLGLVDILIEHGFACERDWKDEREDFLFFIQQLDGVTSNALPIPEELFQEDGAVAEWCNILDHAWAPQEMCMACINIDSDSYVLFPCKTGDLTTLKRFANEIGHRIDLATNM